MRKRIFITIHILLIFSILMGCSKKEQSLGSLMQDTDFTNIQVVDGNTGNLIILDIEQTDELYEKLRSIEAIRDKSSKHHTGWSYAITFVYGSKEVDEFFILSDNKIIYNNYFYKDLNPNIDIEYLKSLFE